MTPDDSELELYTTALRGDLPKASDEARVRKLLAEAGVLAGSIAAPGAALGAATTGGGVAAKVAALPLAVKVGGALVVAGIVATPVVRHAVMASEQRAMKATLSAPPDRIATAARARGSSPRSSANTATGTELAAAPSNLEAPSVATAPVVEARVEPERSRTPSIGARASDGALRTASDTTPLGRSIPASPSVASFEVAPSSARDEGTLRAETALIERALTALRRGDSAAARRALAEHSARFPEGQLVRERERALAKVAEKETSHDGK